MTKSYHFLFERSFFRSWWFLAGLSLPEWIVEWLPKWYEAPLTQIRAICRDIVQEKKDALASGKDQSKDILTTMLQGREIDDAACVDQMLTFLAAGVSCLLYNFLSYSREKHYASDVWGYKNCKCCQ